MANDEERREPEDLGQDPFVERLRPDPSEPPERVRIFEGLLGDSDREGYRRLYFTRELNHYAEFRTEDVIFTEPIPADQSPFFGQQATRVGIRRDANVEFTQLRIPRPGDEFDLDIRLGAQAEARDICIDTVFTLFVVGCGGGGGGGTGRLDTCVGPRCHTRFATDCATCVTDCGDTCNTCQTQCGQPTCRTSPQHTCQTCQTCLGQDTCQTCQTQCGTCETQCGTCQTQCSPCDIDTEFGPRCRTNNPHVFTCGPNPQCF
jgi:hypothetical protein